MSPVADETIELLRRWHAGERQAVHRLLEDHLPKLHDFVCSCLQSELRRLRREHDSLDYVQAVALKVLDYTPPIVPADGEQFQRLLRTFVRNEIRNELRAPRVQNRLGSRESFGDTVLDLRAASDSSLFPDRAAEKREQREEARAWVALAAQFLDDDDRALLDLRAIDNLSWKEIAEALNTSEDGARMRFQRLQPRLANTLRCLRQGGVGRLLEQANA